MKTFVCVNRRDQTYEGLPGDVEFIFDHIDNWEANNFAIFADKLEKALANAEPNDVIVFNGPQFIVALAGYFWFSDSERNNFNVARYDIHEGKYVINTTPIGSAL